MASILTAIEAHHRARPTHVFSHFVGAEGEQTITFADLWSNASRAAATYHRLGVGAGSVVVIILRHCPDLYWAFVGAMMIGAVPTFMPHPSPKQEPGMFWRAHEALFARIEPAILVGYAGIMDRLAQVAPATAAVLDAAELLRGPALSASELAGIPPAAPGDTAFLQHSSGTTGAKKGVMLTHGAVLAQARDYGGAIGLDQDSVVASWLPLYHDMGLIACFVLPLVTGAAIVHLDPFEWVSSPLLLLRKAEQHRATHVWLPNFAFNLLALARKRSPAARFDLGSLRMVVNCSEPCKSGSMEAFTGAFADCDLRDDVVRVCYAMAETVFAATQTTSLRTLAISRSGLTEGRKAEPASADDLLRIVSCGEAIPNMAVAIRAGDGGDCADGTVGEVCIKGDSVYDGYYRLPAVTAARYRDGWHHTGDLGFLWQGSLFVTGRVDDLIIVRGRNFYAHDIEAIVSALPGIKPGRVVVFAVDNETAGTADSVCLAEATADADVAELRRRIKGAVESQSGLILGKVAIEPEGSLVKTTSGKISREANRTRFLTKASPAMTAVG